MNVLEQFGNDWLHEICSNIPVAISYHILFVSSILSCQSMPTEQACCALNACHKILLTLVLHDTMFFTLFTYANLTSNNCTFHTRTDISCLPSTISDIFTMSRTQVYLIAALLLVACVTAFRSPVQAGRLAARAVTGNGKLLCLSDFMYHFV